MVRRSIANAGRRVASALVLGGALAAAVATPASGAAPHVLYAVGDAQAPNVATQNTVAALIQRGGPERLLFLGDLTEHGTPADYQSFYNPSYGRFRSITFPTFGNHDVLDSAAGYNGYWGARVRAPGGGHWYSFDYGGWHFVSLSSEEDRGVGSAQYNWLRSDLAAHKGSCTIAYDHRPRYSAGPQFNTVGLEPIYAALRRHAIVLLSGHAHNYQRMNPIRGITQFVVGTGGGGLGNTDDLDPRLAAKNDHVYGALRLELGVGGARFRYLASSGRQLDRSDSVCVPGFRTPVKFRTQRPKAKKRYRSLRTLYGRVRNAQRLRLTIVRRSRGRCSAFDDKLERFRRRSCKTRQAIPVALKPPAFPGVGTYRWRYKVPGLKSLPSGTYRLDQRVRGLDNKLAKHSTRFMVRR